MVKFDKKMQILPNLDIVNQGVFPSQNGTFQPVIEVSIIPNADQDRSKLDFTWKATAM